MCHLLRQKTFYHSSNSFLFQFISTSPPTSLSFRTLENLISSPLATLRLSKLCPLLIFKLQMSGSDFFCEGRSVLQTNIVQDCLSSLYLGSANLIKANCKFWIDSKHEKIYSLGNNTWLVYLIGTIATNQVCPKTGTLSPLTIKSGQSVMVSHRCHIPTMDHLISADKSEDMEIVNSWLDWTMSLSQLFNHNNNEQLTAMIMYLRKHINGNFDASQLQKQLDMVQKPFSADHWQFSLPAAMFGVAVLIAVVSFAVWKKCCAQASHTAQTPTIAAQLPPQ
jgi:hypothetical protein